MAAIKFQLFGVANQLNLKGFLVCILLVHLISWLFCDSMYTGYTIHIHFRKNLISSHPKGKICMLISIRIATLLYTCATNMEYAILRVISRTKIHKKVLKLAEHRIQLAIKSNHSSKKQISEYIKIHLHTFAVQQFSLL